MTLTEIEKRFYKVFDIEPVYDNTEDNKRYRAYPPITDHVLLGLIVANNENAPAVADSLDELKAQVLYWCIKYKERIYNKVRKIMGVE